MKINKMFLKVMIVAVLVIFIGNINIFAATSYENFIQQAEQQLAQFDGTTNNHNAAEMAKVISLLKQNPDAVQEFLDSIQGPECEALRDWLGIDNNGNIAEFRATQAAYAIATILDTNQYIFNNDCEANWSSYDTYFTAQDQNDEFYLHNIQLALSDFEDSELDSQTWGFIQGLSNNTAAHEGLEFYFEYYVNMNGNGGANALAIKHCEDSEYLTYDGDANVGDINISTGDGEAATGTTTNEAVKDGMDDIANNSVTTNQNENVNTNVESSTGVDMEEYIDDYANNLFGFTNSLAGSKPAFTLANLSNRVNALFNKGENQELGDLTDFVAGDLVSLIAELGKFIMYGAILFFGVRTIWSGVEGKSQFKELLPYLLVAIVFFEFGEEVFNLIKDIVLGGQVEGSQNYETLTSDIWASVLNIVRILAFGGIMFTGVKLLFAGPTAKAEAKSHLLPLLIGCILVFASSTVVSIILGVAKDSGLVKQTSSSNDNLYVVNVEYVDRNKC